MPHVAVLEGDGIGPEVTAAAVRVLSVALPGCIFTPSPVGAAAIVAHGSPLPLQTLENCSAADAILFGAVGGPGFDDLRPEQRPEAAILGLRKHFDLFANVRPARLFAGLEDRSPLRREVVQGMDLVIVRELTAGLYFGTKTLALENGVMTARETLTYTVEEITRVAEFAFELARERRKRLTSIDKNNVLISSQLWRRTLLDTAAQFPDVTLDHILVDNAAMQLIRDPNQFDVIVTDNMFGDILSDEAAIITGSIGTAPSASLGRAHGSRRFGLYEPISGTAPDIAGLNRANPTAAILCAALLARFSLNELQVANTIERAVAEALAVGPHTADLCSPGERSASTTEFTELVVNRLAALATVS